MTPFDYEAGVKGQIHQLEKILKHDSLKVVFTLQTAKSNDKGDTRTF